MNFEHQQVVLHPHPAAVRSPNINVRYLHTSIEERSLSTFSEKLTTTLDDIVRMGGTVVHLSTTTISFELELLRVAHIVSTIPRH